MFKMSAHWLANRFTACLCGGKALNSRGRNMHQILLAGSNILFNQKRLCDIQQDLVSFLSKLAYWQKGYVSLRRGFWERYPKKKKKKCRSLTILPRDCWIMHIASASTLCSISPHSSPAGYVTELHMVSWIRCSKSWAGRSLLGDWF
jgi:hypothetical protein